MENKMRKRYNTYLSAKEYGAIFAFILITSTFHDTVLNGYFNKYWYGYNSIYFMLAMLMNLAVTSIISYFTLIIIRRYFFERPINRIGEATRKIAAGDFTTRIEPMRTDGKEDELTLLLEDFNKMAEELASIETLKTDFIANVSHELKSPLSVIQNYAFAIKDEKLTPLQRTEYANTIITASSKLSTLVTNILQLNRLENQKIFSEAKHYTLGEQLRGCILSVENSWETKDIEMDGDGIADFQIYQYESLLEIIWNNLISNAIKFTPEHGTINITIKKEKLDAVVTVGDTGCGMNKETIRRAFEKFYQGETSHSQEGNGLGLSMVKRVIDMVGGNITVDSTPGKGTLFTVTIPINLQM
ncbi:MAG: ATP-binding protein [Lachnotalea sp.]